MLWKIATFAVCREQTASTHRRLKRIKMNGWQNRKHIELNPDKWIEHTFIDWNERTRPTFVRSIHSCSLLSFFFSADEKSNFLQPLHILRSNYQISALDVVLSFIVHDLYSWCCRQRCKVILHRPKRFVDSIVSYLYWWRRGQWLLHFIFIFGSSQTHTKCFSFSRLTCSVNASFTTALHE